MITALMANKEQQTKIIQGKQCKNYFGKRWVLRAVLNSNIVLADLMLSK